MPDEVTNAPAVEGAATASTPDAPEQKPERPGSWLDRVLGRTRQPASETTTDDASSDEQPEQEAKPETPPPPPKREVTDEELQRLVQAEVDRREAKRRQEEERQRRRQLRESDPVAFAEEDARAEQAAEASQRVSELLGNLAREFDTAAIDPLANALPDDVRQAIIEKAPAGIPGRKYIVTESLKALEKHWKAQGAKEATDKLRKDPAFKKQVLVDVRGEEEEPDYVPAAAAAGNRADMNTWMRKALGRYE